MFKHQNFKRIFKTMILNNISSTVPFMNDLLLRPAVLILLTNRWVDYAGSFASGYIALWT